MTFLKRFSLATAVLAATAPLYAGGGFTFTFDENGNGCYRNADDQPCVQDNGALGLDNTFGPNNLIQTLVYNLPDGFQETGGPIGVKDADGNISDLVDFFNFAGTGQLGFYSLGGPGDNDLADTTLDFVDLFDPTTFVTEAADGSFEFSLDGNTYIGESSPDDVAGTPEPASFFLIGGGLMLAGVGRLRQSSRRRAIINASSAVEIRPSSCASSISFSTTPNIGPGR